MMGMRYLALGTAVFVAGCAPQIIHTGGSPDWQGLSSRSFVLGAAPSGYDRFQAQASAAVRDALVLRGLQPSQDARYRIDVGFAIGPGIVDVLPAGESPPAAARAIGPVLCKRRKFTLSVTMVDRSDGRLLFRSGATLSRCGDATDQILPALAQAALSPG